MRVALFITCFNDTLFPGTGRAVVEVLERLGHEVDFPEEQTCCGQMHANTRLPARGRAAGAALRAASFEDAEVVVSPSASCVGMVREQYRGWPRLAGDAGSSARSQALAAARARAERAPRGPAGRGGRRRATSRTA